MILIGSRLPPSLLPFHLWLHDVAEDVAIIGHAKRFAWEEAPQAFWQRFSEAVLLEDYDESGRFEREALRLHARQRLTQIVAVSELDLFRVAKLRHVLGISGQQPESALAYRDKVLMKDRLAAAGIPVPPYRAVETAIDILEFVERYGPRVVVKPRSGTGAADTVILNSRAKTEEYVDRLRRVPEGLDVGLIVEQYVEGRLYHVDGLQLRGSIILSWPSVYTVDPLEMEAVGYDGSYMLHPEHPLRMRLQNLVAETLAALPTPATTAFHAEAFHTPNDELTVCEIASRTGSWPTNDFVAAGFGVDITRWWVRATCGLPDEMNWRQVPEAPHRYAGFFALMPRPGIFLGIPQEAIKDWMSSCLVEATPGDLLSLPKSTSDRVIQCVITGDTPTEVEGRLRQAAADFGRYIGPVEARRREHVVTKE